MKNRLRKEEKAAINTKYSNDIFYKMLHHTGSTYERKLKNFHLSPDELFVECITILDNIKEKKTDEAKWYVSSLWNDLYCAFRDLDAQDSSEPELETAVAVVLYGLIEFLSLSDKSKYTTLITNLMLQIENSENSINAQEILETYMRCSWKLDINAAKIEFESYMSNNRFISDEIKDLLYAQGTEIGDGSTPCLPHRFRFCKSETTLERAKEINQVLWDYCHSKDYQRVLLQLTHTFKDDIDLKGIKAADLYSELHYCYGMDDVKLRQFQNYYQKQK